MIKSKKGLTEIVKEINKKFGAGSITKLESNPNTKVNVISGGGSTQVHTILIFNSRPMAWNFDVRTLNDFTRTISFSRCN